LTTDGEFHAIRRQLDRLAEEGLEIVKLPADPTDSLAARLAEAVDDRTAAVLVSAVLFRSGRIVPGLGAVATACQRAGAELLVDAYHALNVMPFSLPAEGLTTAYVTGAGYKYCQLGEGNGFLRLPADCGMRPAVTGWFAEFATLSASPESLPVPYPEGGARFAGATYDPISHYRGAAVFGFFAEQELTPAGLREISQHQIGMLARGFDDLALDPAVITRDRSFPLTEQGGFLVLTSPRASEICAGLGDRGVTVDRRGSALRLGPAPYLSDRQLTDAVTALGETVGSLPVG
jgi:kynureninase